MTRKLNPECALYCLADAESTANAWSIACRLCAEEREIGFDALDSFLSDPDLERRVRLVLDEAPGNVWLRLQLRDTLQLCQPQWSERFRSELLRASGLP